MKKCKHTSARWSEWTGEEWREVGTLAGHPLGRIAGNFGRLTCLDCGAWLSLGPASPPPPEEIEAATILADVYANVEHITVWQIAIGMAAYDADNDPPTGGLAWMWHAGWLARHMWKEQERG